MGYERNHAIVVTGGYSREMDDVRDGSREWADFAREAAVRICGGRCPVTEVVEGVTNTRRSFAILPDGSKEGWDASGEGDDARASYVHWLEQQAYEDGSSPLAWVEVQFGDDEHDSRVLRHSDEPNGTECRPYSEAA